MKKEMKTTTDISKLIARKILGDTLAPEEEAALQAWLSDERNAATYEEVKRLDLVSAMLRLEREDYGGRMVARPPPGPRRPPPPPVSAPCFRVGRCGSSRGLAVPGCAPVLHGVSRATAHSRRR